MRRFSDRHQLQTLSELNVTPLLDLAFVLLIIFMITTPLMENSTELALPTGDAVSEVNADKVRTVSMMANGELRLGESAMSLEDIEDSLASAREADPELAVLIRPHKELPIQRLSEVLDAVRRAGVRRIGFASTLQE